MRWGRLRLRCRTHNTQSRSVPLPDLTPAQRRRFVAEVIAYAFRDGVWVANRMAERAAHDLDIESGRWLMKIAQRATASFAVSPIEEPRGFNRWVEAQLVSH